MNLSASEVLRRCNEVGKIGDYDPHSKFAIQTYLSVSLYFGDINETTFSAMIKYFDEIFRIERIERSW